MYFISSLSSHHIYIFFVVQCCLHLSVFNVIIFGHVRLYLVDLESVLHSMRLNTKNDVVFLRIFSSLTINDDWIHIVIIHMLWTPCIGRELKQANGQTKIDEINLISCWNSRSVAFKSFSAGGYIRLCYIFFFFRFIFSFFLFFFACSGTWKSWEFYYWISYCEYIHQLDRGFPNIKYSMFTNVDIYLGFHFGSTKIYKCSSLLCTQFENLFTGFSHSTHINSIISMLVVGSQFEILLVRLNSGRKFFWRET